MSPISISFEHVIFLEDIYLHILVVVVVDVVDVTHHLSLILN